MDANTMSIPTSRFTLIAIIIVAIVAAGIGLQPYRRSHSHGLESVTFGTIDSHDADLVYIAQDRGFFATNGLNGNASSDEIAAANLEAATAHAGGDLQDDAAVVVFSPQTRKVDGQ
jgi:hypothetical protein